MSYIIAICSNIRVNTKIHHILQFAQSLQLREYIEFNTNFRTLAKNEFEKILFKLMNNVLFSARLWRMCVKFINVKLLTKQEGRYDVEAMFAKPNFHSRSVFSENLVAIEMWKLEMNFDKLYISWTYPRYVCMNFITYVLPLFHEKYKIMTLIVSYIMQHATMSTLL